MRHNQVSTFVGQDHTVGMLMQSLRMNDQRNADESLILDVLATEEKRTISTRVLKIISDNVRIPVTVGGGIHSLDTAKSYINLGADKICLNSVIINDIRRLSEFTSSLGSQAIVVNVDYRWVGARPHVFDYRKKSILNLNFAKYIAEIMERGAGEIIFSCVEKDGSLSGFDYKMIEYLEKLNVSIPIIISGGGGNPDHFLRALGSNPSAAAGGTIFSLTEHTPQTLRKVCQLNGLPMRVL